MSSALVNASEAIKGAASEKIRAQMASVLKQTDVQQAINCCQSTAVAFALTSLGFPTTVDDIFRRVYVNIDSAVGDGMTLAETHELALRYIRYLRLPVFVECYHFDPHLAVTEEDVWEAAMLDSAGGADDILALNFHSGVAHGREGGGGHFALLVGPLVKERKFVMADVHPLKYGPLWKQDLSVLLKAMQHIDSCGRARGLLRFGLTHSHELVRPLPTLARCLTVVDWLHPDRPYDRHQLRQFIPAKWDSHLGARNMAGASAIAYGLSVLQPEAKWHLDRVMRTLRESYTEHLNSFRSPEQLYRLVLRLNLNDVQATQVPLAANITGAALQKLLKDNGAGSDGALMLVAYNLARVRLDPAAGSPAASPSATRKEKKLSEKKSEKEKKERKENSEKEKEEKRERKASEKERKQSEKKDKKKPLNEVGVLSHTDLCWSAIAAINPGAKPDSPDGVIIATAHDVIAQGRLWRTSFDNLARGINHFTPNAIVKIRKAARSDQSQVAKLDRVIAVLDADGDGKVTPEELRSGLGKEGILITDEQARQLIREGDKNHDGVLDRNEMVNLLAKILGRDGSQHPELFKFLEGFGCEPNDLGFATCHLAIKAADVRACVLFYNGLLGWPLYKTVDRAHAGLQEQAYGSSWASFGAFASFVVFHQEDIEAGTFGHGAWSNPRALPACFGRPAVGAFASADVLGRSNPTDDKEVSEMLRRRQPSRSRATRTLAQTAAGLKVSELACPFHGVILSPSFFAKQMARIEEKDAKKEVQWAELSDAGQLFGGELIDKAVVLRDPEGYPCVLFQAKLSDEAYHARFPAAPFVYGQYIRGFAPGDPAEPTEAEVRATCPILGDKGKYVKAGQGARRDAWLKQHFRVGHGIAQHEHYYEKVLGWERRGKVVDEAGGWTQLEYEMEGHFLVCRTHPQHQGPLLVKSDHDMGGNKSFVPVPHYGVNTSYEKFARMRARVKAEEEKFLVPKDAVTSLCGWGHGPAISLLNPYDALFPTDPDSCMSLLCNDPSGNTNEMKWYLDFGEMFHHKGEVGMGGYKVDNSLLKDHFPPKVLDQLKRREARGSVIGLGLAPANKA